MRSMFLFFWKLIDRPLNFLEWVVTDHNGKPSTSRLLLWIWSGFSIWWITVVVLATHTITMPIVYIVIISLLGPSMAIVMKGASAKDFVAIITSIAGGNVTPEPITKRIVELIEPCPGEEDGA